MAAGKRASRLSIRLKLVLLIGTVITALMVVDVAWNVQIQRKQSAVEAHEKA